MLHQINGDDFYSNLFENHKNKIPSSPKNVHVSVNSNKFNTYGPEITPANKKAHKAPIFAKRNTQTKIKTMAKNIKIDKDIVILSLFIEYYTKNLAIFAKVSGLISSALSVPVNPNCCQSTPGIIPRIIFRL